MNVETRFGEEVRVSGNAPALGRNNPAHAVPLTTSSADLPWWSTKGGLFMSGDVGGNNTVHGT